MTQANLEQPRPKETAPAPPPAPDPATIAREKEREKEARILAKVKAEATLYATCFDQLSQRLAPWLQDRDPKTGIVTKEGLSWSDVKDAATSLFIQVERTIDGIWMR